MVPSLIIQGVVQEGDFPLLCYLSPFSGESNNVSDSLPLVLQIPASIETEIAFIESHNYLISLARLSEMCLASQWLCRAKSPANIANRATACPRNGLASGRGHHVPQADQDLWLFLWVFCFSSQKQCVKTPGDFPSAIPQVARLPMTLFVSDGVQWEGQAEGDPRALSTWLREVG